MSAGAYDGCEEKRRVASITIHPSFDASWLYHDVAILKLSDPVSYSPISSLEDAAVPVEAAGTLVTVAGWGATYDGGNSGAAKHVQVPVISQVKRC